MDRNPRPSGGFHISDILQLNNPTVAAAAAAENKPRSPMDYSMYTYNDYQSRQHYYSSYHSQILPSTLTSFESDLPFYSTTFGTAPPNYGSVYYSSDPPLASNAYPTASPMIPPPSRLIINDMNNNNFGNFEKLS